ncbi:MAG: hypothetical protein LBD81_02270, partial [Holosporaceae bacterium]|nr:hypothetical protein [Holosporaceae bacterium]
LLYTFYYSWRFICLPQTLRFLQARPLSGEPKYTIPLLTSDIPTKTTTVVICTNFFIKISVDILVINIIHNMCGWSQYVI